MSNAKNCYVVPLLKSVLKCHPPYIRDFISMDEACSYYNFYEARWSLNNIECPTNQARTDKQVLFSNWMFNDAKGTRVTDYCAHREGAEDVTITGIVLTASHQISVLPVHYTLPPVASTTDNIIKYVDQEVKAICPPKTIKVKYVPFEISVPSSTPGGPGISAEEAQALIDNSLALLCDNIKHIFYMSGGKIKVNGPTGCMNNPVIGATTSSGQPNIGWAEGGSLIKFGRRVNSNSAITADGKTITGV